ncbi:MAG: hypothetical protein ACE14V_11010 [bacterium]
MATIENSVGFELIGDILGQDLETRLALALASDTVFPTGNDPISIFRSALSSSIRNIQTHPRGKLFQEFLIKGPYGDHGPIPQDKRDLFSSDEEVTRVIAFIYGHMVNCFKGAITELFATVPCIKIINQLQQEGKLPATARLYAGDTVYVKKLNKEGYAKGADLHILIDNDIAALNTKITIAGVGEVKSYFRPKKHLIAQVDNHILRLKKGIKVGMTEYSSENIAIGYGKTPYLARITVYPDTWKLPRTFHFEPNEKGRLLYVDPMQPPEYDDRITRINETDWQVTLRWSKEAIAEAAYEMTFWYMGKVGEEIYAQQKPKGLEYMSPDEAGRNVAKMMLYYSILRCRTDREYQRAIALYNSYCFGYALGMNYKDDKGRREMLWPEDLDKLAAVGHI